MSGILARDVKKGAMNKHHRSGAGTRPTAKAASAAPEGIRNRVRLKIDAAGRVLIPADIRQAMDVGEGSVVLAWLDDGELHLVGARTAAAHAQRLARELMPGRDSLADKLLADRREEVGRESKNG
jgi:AbrB family looped-hinge helix DNA binding protein